MFQMLSITSFLSQTPTHLFVVLYLFLSCRFDIKNRSVPVWFVIAGGAGCAVLCFFLSPPAGYLLTGLIPGIFLLILSVCTKEAIGMADTLIILMLGAVYGFWDTLLILFFSFAASFIYSSIMMLKKKFHRRSSFAFLPFLTAGYIGGILFEAFL